MDKQKLEAIKVALAALDALACNPNHANRQEVALGGWNALHDAFGQEPDGGSGREPMNMDRYQEANAAFRIDGYYSPPPLASAVPAAFEVARAECLSNMRADVERVERLSWEQFIRGRKDRPSWWGRCKPNTELDEANDEIEGMRQDWQKVGEALGFKDFVDPEVIIERVQELHGSIAPRWEHVADAFDGISTSKSELVLELLRMDDTMEQAHKPFSWHIDLAIERAKAKLAG